jgi:division protein CdvB (Snf7/Vps24/ESCRT-III family)
MCTNAVTAGLTHLSNSADIEKEVLILKREEQKLTREIKQAAAKGNTAGAKQLAKSLIRLRGQEAKLQASMGQLRAVKTSIAVCASANLTYPSSCSMSGSLLMHLQQTQVK